MGYSEAAMMGVKDNGKDWKSTIRGVPDAMDAIRAGILVRDIEATDAGLRRIHSAFKGHVDVDTERMDTVEALEFFEEESCSYEFGSDDIENFEGNVNYYLGVLYDHADYNRIWVDPTRFKTLEPDELIDSPSP